MDDLRFKGMSETLDNELQCLDWTIAVLAGVSYTASLLPLHHYIQLDVIRYSSDIKAYSWERACHSMLRKDSNIIYPTTTASSYQTSSAVYIETDWQFIYSNILSSRNRFFGRISKR